MLKMNSLSDLINYHRTQIKTIEQKILEDIVDHVLKSDSNYEFIDQNRNENVNCSSCNDKPIFALTVDKKYTDCYFCYPCYQHFEKVSSLK